MATLLGALLRNESGGRNIPNVHQGTSSGQAQGYFQITTGTWNDFGGRKYASNPLGATYEQQAEIASKIPLKRWDKSTLAAMQATGRRIDPNATLGQNLAMYGEGFGGGARDGGQPAAPAVMDGPKGDEQLRPAGYSTRPHGPVEAAGGGYGSDPVNPSMPSPVPGAGRDDLASTMAGAAEPKKKSFWKALGEGLGSMGDAYGTGGGGGGPMRAVTPQAARMDAPAPLSPIDPQATDQQRQLLALAIQRLNSGRLF
jgi:hypothetical protein